MTTLELLAFSAGALRGHRLRTALSLVGVAVGVTSVVLLTSLGEGARVFITGEFAALGSNLLIVTPGRNETTGFAPPIGGATHDLTLDDASAIQRVPGVRTVAPMAIGSATVRSGDLTRDTVVIGATSEWQSVRRLVLRTGEFLPAGESDRDRAVAVIGSVIERELFPGRSAMGQILRIGDERFRVIGVAAARGTNLGMNLDEIVLIPVVRHMKMFNETTLPRMLVEVQSHAAIADTRHRVVDLLTARHDDKQDVTVETQESMLATFSSLLTMLTMALTGIAAISLSVAGVGIMNVMLVSVSERTAEVGLLKAIGATSTQILKMFVTEAALLSTLGGSLGLVVAWTVIASMRWLYPSFPMRPPEWAMPMAVAVSVSVGVIFGVLPARRAARLDPVGALNRR